MKRQHLLALALAIAGATSIVCAQETMFAPNVPTSPGVPGFIDPWELWHHGPAGYGAVPLLVVPGNPRVSAAHKLDLPGGWLIALSVPSDLAGGLPGLAESRDVIHYDYAIFEGNLASLYSHSQIQCSTGGATSATVSYAAGNTYYLVAPLNDVAEGSHGVDSSGIPRPRAAFPAGRCRPLRVLTPCP